MFQSDKIDLFVNVLLTHSFSKSVLNWGRESKENSQQSLDERES